MVEVAKVMMFGEPIATFRWDSRYNVVLFEYDRIFVGRGLEPSPLMMPVRQGVVYSFSSLNSDTYNRLPGMLADSLPDTYGRALFDRWLRTTGRRSGNPIETLCFMGKRCMGALEFEPPIETGGDINQKIEIETLVDVARDALREKSVLDANLDADRKAAIEEILRLGTSAGGQRAKAIIAYNKETGEVRSGQLEAPDGFDYYLIKLDGVTGNVELRETENFGRLEYSFYRAARSCGIDMTYSTLIEENGRAHFMTKRFDRKEGRKVHMQTLCGIAHLDFRLQRAHSYEQAFDVMRALRLPYSQAQEMFRRMVFNVIVRNQDDHTKNISFLMDEKGTWSLSPAYDMGYAYNPEGQWTSTHQMSINGKFDGISREDLLECARRNNIKNATDIIEEVKEALCGWHTMAKDCGVPQTMIDSIVPNLLLSI